MRQTSSGLSAAGYSWRVGVFTRWNPVKPRWRTGQRRATLRAMDRPPPSSTPPGDKERQPLAPLAGGGLSARAGAAARSSPTEWGFKTCPCCRTIWRSRNELLADGRVRLLGFQPVERDHTAGIFLFHHEDCGTTLALNLRSLKSLSRRPLLARSGCSAGVPPDYCLGEANAKPCPLQCACEFVAEVAIILRDWPKARPPDPSR